MSEAEKEATATGIYLKDVVKQMKHKLALQKKLKFRKSKKLNSVKGTDKDVLLGKSYPPPSLQLNNYYE